MTYWESSYWLSGFLIDQLKRLFSFALFIYFFFLRCKLKRVEGLVTFEMRKCDETFYWLSHFWIDQ